MFGRMSAESSSPPVGEDNWVAYVDEARRTADDLEKRVNVIELYKQAISAEPGSVKIWLAYCEFFHSLYAACQGPSPPSWSAEEIMMGREVFSLDQDLDLWQTAYEDIRLRIGDSHVLWDRWVDVELEQLARTRTREGVERITLLYRDRLRTPHMTWDETSQRFSSFLSEHNREGWEATMKEVTESAQEAKAIVDARQRFEFPLQKAARDGNVEEERSVMREYLAWEIAQSKRKDESSSAVQRCRALFSRALAGVLTKDGTAWLDYIAYLSANLPAAQSVSSLLSPLQRAVDHCPWSGPLWSRYILAAEEAGLSFDDIEKVKHSATNNSQLYRDGLASLLEMYVAWCGYLKRIAMDPNASEEAVDVADVGLPAALESVGVLGNRLYGADFQGDPDFRLERTYILYLTEKKGAIEDARAQWEVLSRKQLYGDKYDFWRAYYLWEMQAFHMAGQAKLRSASGSSAPSVPVTETTPEKATAVLARAVNRKTLDWPERAIAVYLQHCNDYELPRTVRRARDNVHKIRIAVAKRRERETREAAAAYAYQAQVQAEAGDAEGAAVAAGAAEAPAPESPSGTKRKRGDTLEEDETASKRPKGEAANGEAAQSKESEENGPRRDREHTSVLMTNLPADVTQTAIKKYLKDFGHIQNMTLVRDKDAESSTALVEFEDVIDAEDCVKFRDNKYLGESQIRVKSGAGLTLFVTNYPPAADDEYIRDLFKDCGEILSVRWPSLKFNTRRRFCYVSFRDQAGAEKATRLTGKTLEGKYRLEAKYSDPSRRKKRSDAVSEKREVFVGNLDAALREGDIQDVFGKYGAIVRVSMVGSRPGQMKGHPSAFVEYEKAEDAERAIAELHNTKLKSRVLAVVLARPKASLSGKITNPDAPSGGGHRAPEGDQEGAQQQESGAPSPPPPSRLEGPPPGEVVPPVDLPRDIYDNPAIRRKVAVMNLPDTVNEARVLELARPIGEVEKLVLQPRKGSAVVTFVDEAAAGRAMMGLDGKEWEGVTLRTGGMAELGRYTGRDSSVQSRGVPKREKGGERSGEKGEAKKGKGSLAPVNVRRPVLGGRGGKRGLGRPVASVASKEKGEGKEGETGTAAGGGGKSNADFKAMFLGGGQS